MPTLNTYAAVQIATAAAPPTDPVLPRLLPAPVAVAPNLTAATAIDIGTTLPYTTQQNVNFGGTTQTVWYKYTAQPGDVVIDVFAFGDLVVYLPVPRIFSPTATSAYLGLTNIGDANKPRQFPVVVGDTYWISVVSQGGNKATALLTLSVRRAPKNSSPAGAILINDDTAGFAAAVLSAVDGAVVQFRFPFAASEQGDVLQTGELCFQDIATPAGPRFYDNTLTLVSGASSPLAFTGIVSTNSKITQFYLGNSAGPTATTASKLGVQGPTTWSLTGPGLNGMAPSTDETILYYAGSGNNTPVKRWDLVNNVALTDLVVGIALYSTNDIVVLADGTLLVVYYGSIPTTVKHYSAAGATLDTYTFAGNTVATSRICRAIDDPNSFWIYLIFTDGSADLRNIKVSDGSAIATLTVRNYESGIGQSAAAAVPLAFFGPSQSCPILILRTALRLSTDCPSIT